MRHTVITINLASFHLLNEEKLDALLRKLNDTVDEHSFDLDLDEWKNTVIQHDNDGTPIPIPGWRAPDEYRKDG